MIQITQEEENKKLIKAIENSNVKAVQNMKVTALVIACRRGYSKIIELLLDAGADPNAIDIHGYTPLMYAAEGGNIEAMEILLQAGADVNIIDIKGMTPLMYAANAGKTDAINTLVKAGANIEIKNNSGDTALDILKFKHPDQYSIWDSIWANKAVLAYEDAAAEGDVCSGPDFSL